MTTTRYLLTRPFGASPVIVRHDDAASLPVLYPRGYTPPVEVRCVESDGRLYALHPDCPDDGLDVLDVAAVEAKESALDVEFAKLSPEARAAAGLADWEPIGARKAKRAAEEADAQAKRAAEEADAQAKRAAVDESAREAQRGRP